MIQSMTGYARKEIKRDAWMAVWELRSVNQRYLETTFRLSESFRSLEPIIRERLKKRISRGKIECTLKFEFNDDTRAALNLNHLLISQLINAIGEIKSKTETVAVSPIDLLRWPGVLVTQEENFDLINTELVRVFDEAIADFIESRQREGKALSVVIEQRLTEINVQIDMIRQHMPKIMQWQHDKIANRFSELKLDVDNTRLEQELVLLAQRIDVDEELDRLALHVNETRAILAREESVGRRLDFMMQELNREANTLASKSINHQVTASAIELKVLIEQMREQIQNIE